MMTNNAFNSNDQDDVRNEFPDETANTGSFDSSDESLDEDTNFDDEDEVNETYDTDDDEVVAVTDSYPGETAEPKPDEIPEKHVSENEQSEYPHETEVEQQDRGDEAGYTGTGDASAPTPHEFPSYGNAKTDFASRNQGRTTGRMVGHEPGTEGI